MDDDKGNVSCPDLKETNNIFHWTFKGESLKDNKDARTYFFNLLTGGDLWSYISRHEDKPFKTIV
jgi:hypothetical protein